MGKLAWRDWSVDGVPSSGPHRPSKADIRTFIAAVDQKKGHVFTNITEVRAYSGDATFGFVKHRISSGDLGGWGFAVKQGDTSSPDDGIFALADSLGRRWARQHEQGRFNATWGVPFDGVTSADAMLSDAIAGARGGILQLPAGNILLTGTTNINLRNITLLGADIANYNTANSTSAFPGELSPKQGSSALPSYSKVERNNHLQLTSA